MKKCIIIPDSFKGTLSSQEICQVVGEAVEERFPACRVVRLPVADGGEGTVDCFLQALPGGERIQVAVQGPWGEPVKSFYGRFGDLAVVEMAAAAGLPMVGDRKNPAQTTTYGVGELIRHAVAGGARRVILGLGGSCTNDGGCGCAAALGAVFADQQGKSFVPVGQTLGEIAAVDTAPARALLAGVELTAICDVESPLTGPAGAAHVFGPQKGADGAMVALLDQNLAHLAAVAGRCLGNPGAGEMPGAGAAGGLGFGVAALLGGTLRRGIETVLDAVGFDRELAGADLVVTGEGKIDGQSLKGKVVVGVATRAKAQKVPVVAIVGDVGDDISGVYGKGVTAVFSINRVAVPLKEAQARSRQDLAATAADILRLVEAFIHP